MSFKLPDLPYATDALEPAIDQRTMEIHHGKHHAAYVTNLNGAVDGTPHADASLEQLLADLKALPAEIRGAVRNNGGGHWNHSQFWTWLAPSGTGGEPSDALAAAIESDLGGMDAMKAAFEKAGMTRFGSGWAWVIVGADGKLAITSTPNQDNPLMKGVADVTGTPILGVDVWEHAYYLNYQNRRADYLGALWDVINWNAVNDAYQATQ